MRKVYLASRFIQALLFTTITTVNLVYQATVVGLNPLQLVLVGTLLEAVNLVAQIPTGIFADIYSRKASTIIGVILIGIGFMIEGSVPKFEFVLLSQIVWGVGSTFVYGARESWITEEIGVDQANSTFFTGQQTSLIGSMIGIVLSVLLANVNIRLPILLGGLLYSIWGCCLIFLMRETHFHPQSKASLKRVHHITQTLKDSLKLIKAHHLLLTIIIIGGVFGLFSEGFDRLWTPYLLELRLPEIGNFKPIVWFGIINFVGMLLSIVATEITKRAVDVKNRKSVPSGLLVVNILLTVGVVMFGLSRNFIYAIGSYWFIYLFRETSLYDAWINQHVSSNVRATVFSIANQANSIGQIIGGPILGIIATTISLRAGILSSAIALIALLLLYAFAIKRNNKFA